MGAAAAPMLIGSALGAVTNRRNPLQGALLGGVLGGVGGSFMSGFGGAGNAAATTAMTGANPAVMGTAGMGVAPMTAGATYNAAAPGMVANFGNATMPTYAATGGTTGLIGSSTAPVAMADRFAGGMNALKSDISSLGTFAKENPLAAGQGLQAAKGVLFPEPVAAPTPQGLIRGTPSQEQPTQYAMGMPEIRLI
jgi:hypothetical protein